MIKFSTRTSPQPKSYFLSQPHQPFFLFGVIWAVVSMIFFTLSHKGLLHLSVSENSFHLYTLAFIVFIQFFHGFLFTTLPRFCTSMSIPKEVYIRIVWLYQISGAAFFIGALVSPLMAWIAMIGILFAQVMAAYVMLWVYRMGQSAQKSDPFWILIAQAFGLGAHALWIIAFAAELLEVSFDWLRILNPVIINLFLIFLTFSVAQRMIPFFSHSPEAKSPRFVESVFALLLLKTLCAVLAFSLAEAAVSILLSAYLLREFLRWKLPLFRSPAILWVLHLALYWLPAALLIGAVLQLIETIYGVSFLFAGIHLLVLGFLTTVLIGFGTRVTLGHSGHSPHADTLAVLLFWWTQVVLLSRLALSLDSAYGLSYGWLFDLTSAAWILLFIVWGWRYGKILIFGKPNL
ncbi:MAG: NnrS family protein [Sulfuricurvum sp.]|jgi:uncharacterized protein involved in response to NO|uniref:NnrS family protein n=1 Tax=Sulfuricurvum sp. TaxID=2025608 RepID=UPI0025E4373D|nr:NnrS family protein [Sulfuricurvum sp.]MCK9372232.1 NnrS family protein [Sulfuricurvum sp.]